MLGPDGICSRPTRRRRSRRKLIADDELAPHRRPRFLKGEVSDCMECHLGDDRLLICRLSEDEIVFVRTGTHEDLFG